MRSIAATIATVLLVAGCIQPTAREGTARADRAEQSREIGRLRQALEQAEDRLADQQRQIATLQALGPRRLESLHPVRRIRLGRYTGGYDIDGAGGPDGVKVYLEPIDAAGSVVKAGGAVTIELFDLAGGDEPVALAACRFNIEEVAAHWCDGVLTHHYSFICPWGDRPPAADEVTLRVTFVDYLTGKTFTAQRRCIVERAPAMRPDPDGSSIE